MTKRLLMIGAIGLAATPATAANVNLSATLANSCILSIGTSGLMTANSAGTQIGSENAGGAPATLTVTAIGLSPNVTFAAPSLSASPAGWSASPTLAIRYTSLDGAAQAYTSGQSSFTITGVSDTFTVHGKVDSAAGFAAGAYTLTTVATCSQ